MSICFIIVTASVGLGQIKLIGPSEYDLGSVTEDSSRVISFSFINQYKFSVIPQANWDFDLSSRHTPTLAKPGDTVLYEVKVNASKVGPFEKTFMIAFFDIIDTVSISIKANIKSFDWGKNGPLDAFDRKLRKGDEIPRDFSANFLILDLETKKPIPNASVSISSNTVPYKSLKTNSKGEVERILHNGYSVRINASGYESAQLNISLGCNDGLRTVMLPKYQDKKREFEYKYDYEATSAIKNDEIDQVLLPVDHNPEVDTTSLVKVANTTGSESTGNEVIFEPLTDNHYKANNLVFLMDVSGSMNDHDRFELLKQSMLQMVSLMREKDLVTIITFSDATEVLLPPTNLNKNNIDMVVSKLTHFKTGGQTNAGKGLKMAFKIAKENFEPSKNNQVILSTDGALNSYMKHDDVIKMVKKYSNEIQTSVVTLVGYAYTKKYMKEIVEAGKGHLLPINSEEEAKTMLIREIKTNSIIN